MKILECIFNGVILECDCGESRHVAFRDLHGHACDCGKRFELDAQALDQMVPAPRLARVDRTDDQVLDWR